MPFGERGMESAVDFLDLLERGRGGDPDALSLLVQQYEREVRLMARVLLGPALRPYLDSLDLVQSIHRSLLIGLHGGKFELRSPQDLLALAITMVRRKVARQWRHHRRQKRLDSPSDSQDLPDVLVSLTSPADDPLRAAQFNDQVRDLCRHLSDAERTIMQMRLEGYATAEIAEHLGLSGVALRVRMTRLRQRLQQAGVLDDWL
jgi:RNA polymerase sigma-70 factor (ECF subfamily)